jgi:ATP-dependent Clp endopeptidase proteolytic subunit ClpP
MSAFVRPRVIALGCQIGEFASMATQIFLYGQIGDPAAGLDAKTVTDQVRAASGDLTVYINSPGGFVFEGLPIYEALRSYTAGKVIVQIDGFALSMASLIAMAGSRIVMASTALMMIHRPWDSALGNAGDLRAEANRLEKIEKQLIAVYAGRSAMAESKVAALMAAETWFTAEEALAAGLITEISEPVRAVALADLSPLGFRNLPANMKGSPMTAPAPTITAPPTGQTVAMSADQVREVNALVEAHRLPQSVATDIFRKGMSMEGARAHILEALAGAGDAYDIGGLSTAGALPTAQNSFDNPQFFGRAITDLIYSRMAGKAPEGAARELANMSLVDLAREMVGRNGVRNAHRMRAEDVLAAASWAGPRASRGGTNWIGSTSRNNSTISHTTSDFPGLLLDSGQRYLLDMYQAAETGLKSVARLRSARDFRAITGVQLSSFGTLPSVAEAGEIQQGTFTERKESFALTTYAKIFTITMQAIVNDDLGAFTDMFRIMGRAAAETEAQTFAALINSNPTMADGNALFSSAHGNIVASGGAPSVAELDKLRQLMRLQKDMDGTTFLNLRGTHLVVPAQLETVASNIALATWRATEPANANPFADLVKVVVEPRLSSALQWYSFADPALAPVLEYAYLNGNTGPQVEMRDGWQTLGQEYRVVMHLGVGITGWAGAARNSGAA